MKHVKKILLGLIFILYWTVCSYANQSVDFSVRTHVKEIYPIISNAPEISCNTYKFQTWENFDGSFFDVSSDQSFNMELTVTVPSFSIARVYAKVVNQFGTEVWSSGEEYLNNSTNFRSGIGKAYITAVLPKGKYKTRLTLFWSSSGIGGDGDHTSILSCRYISSFGEVTNTRNIGFFNNFFQDSGGSQRRDFLPWGFPNPEQAYFQPSRGGSLQVGSCEHSVTGTNRNDVNLSFNSNAFCSHNNQGRFESDLSLQIVFPDIRRPPNITPQSGTFVARQISLDWRQGYYPPQGADRHYYQVIIASASAGFSQPFFDRQNMDPQTFTFPHPVYQKTDYVWKVIASNPSWPNSIVSQGSFTIDPDVIAPGAIADLNVSNVLTHAVDLHWTAPGDDGVIGTATRYDLRYATNPIAENGCEQLSNCFNFNHAKKWDFSNPKIAGSAESITINNLKPATTYFFAIKTIDDFDNVSTLSNLASIRTLFDDSVPPAGSLLINSGAPSTKNLNVLLNLHLIDTDSLNEHTDRNLRAAFSHDGTNFTALESYQPIKNWQLQNGRGFKKVFVKYVDEAGNESISAAQIFYDDFQDPFAQIQLSGASVTVHEDLTILQPGTTAQVQVVTSETLVSPPVLVLLMPDQSQMNIFLNGSEKNWSGALFVPSTSPAGAAQFFYSGRDANGSSPQIVSGKTILIEDPLRLFSGGDHEFVLLTSEELGPNPSVQLQLPGRMETISFFNPSGDRTTWLSNAFSNFNNLNGNGSVSLTVENRYGLRSSEILGSSSFTIDTQPPVTQFNISNAIQTQENIYSAGSKSEVSFTAEDLLVNTISSGLEKIEFSLEGGAFQKYESAFHLASGLHHLEYRSQDLAQNMESVKSVFISVDAEAPTIRITKPSGKEEFVARQDTAAVQFSVSDNLDLNPIIQARLEPVAAPQEAQRRESSSADTRSSISVMNNQELLPENIPAGFWKLVVTAEDQFQNASSSETVPFEIIHDALPPQTTLSIGEPAFMLPPQNEEDKTKIFISSMTPLILSAQDDLFSLSDHFGLGVDSIELNKNFQGYQKIENAKFQADLSLKATFYISDDGAQFLSFRSKDVLGNTELTQSTRVYVDNLSPVSVLRVQAGPEFFINGKQTFVSTRSTLLLDVFDPVIYGAASGVRNAAFTQCFESESAPCRTVPNALALPPFSLTEGLWKLTFQSADNVGNWEPEKIRYLYADGTPPQSHWADSVQTVIIGTMTFINGNKPLTLTASDEMIIHENIVDLPLLSSGVRRIYVSSDTHSFYPNRFSFNLEEGTHTVTFYSEDQVGNIEAQQSQLFYVDRTSPTVEFKFLAGGDEVPFSFFREGQSYLRDNLYYVPSNTRLRFEAKDPISSGIASGFSSMGISMTEHQRGGGTLRSDEGNTVDDLPFETFTQSVATLNVVSENIHTITYYAQDRVGHSSTHTIQVALDETPPVTHWAVRGRNILRENTLYISSRAVITFESQDLLSHGLASGAEKLVLEIDNTKKEIVISTNPIALSFQSGKHSIGFYSIDFTGNVEQLRWISIQVEDSPPISQLQIGEPKLLSGDQWIVGEKTPVVLSAVDGLDAEGSGIKAMNYTLDQAKFSLDKNITLYLSSGTHHLEFFAEDSLGNKESPKFAAFWVDATAPKIQLILETDERTFINLRKGKIHAQITVQDNLDPNPTYSVQFNRDYALEISQNRLVDNICTDKLI